MTDDIEHKTQNTPRYTLAADQEDRCFFFSHCSCLQYRVLSILGELEVKS